MIKDYLNFGHKNPVPRSVLRTMTGLTDTAMRQAISRERLEYPILNMEDGSGYFLPDLTDETDRELVVRWTKKIRSRAYKLLKIANVAEGHLGGNIYRSARQLACMTQGDVSRLTGISVPKLSEIETGKTIPTEEEHKAIERACKVRI